MQRIDGAMPSVSTFNRLIHACAKVSDFTTAERLLADMKDNFLLLPDDITYSTVVQAAVNSGKMDKAVDLLQTYLHQDVEHVANRKMRVQSEKFSQAAPAGKQRTPHIFNHIMTGFSREKNHDKVATFFSQLLRTGRGKGHTCAIIYIIFQP